jgi:integrase
MAKRLTDIAVRNLRPKAKEYTVWDTTGIGRRVWPSGRASWIALPRVSGVQIKITYPGSLRLAEVRKAYADDKLKIDKGINPVEERRAQEQAAKIAADLAAQDTVASLSAQFLAKYARAKNRPSYAQQQEGIFRRIVVPAWQGRTVHNVTKRDVIGLIDDIATGDGETPARPILANRVLACVHKFYEWLIERDFVSVSPCRGVKSPSKENVRDRVLSDAEIAQLWRACDEIGPLYGAAIRLLLLTGQRRSEIGSLPWTEIDTDRWLWALSSVRSKSKMEHVIPLSRQARDILTSLPKHPVFVFGKKLNDWGRVKERLDERLQLKTPFRLHDIRRSTASGLQKIGTPPAVIEKILGHQVAFKGIAAVYQRFSYSDEKAAALQKWADYVEALVAGRPVSNVVQLLPTG